jgi:hypothetical protein
MVSATDFPMMLPRSMIGTYRLNVFTYTKADGKKMTECTRLYFEIAEV